MTSFEISPIVATPASGPGALDGFEARCSCGLVMRSSLRTLLEQDVADHAAYHARRAADVELVRERIAKAIARRMREGASYDEATAEAFAYCDRRWPTVVAALIAEARS